MAQTLEVARYRRIHGSWLQGAEPARRRWRDGSGRGCSSRLLDAAVHCARYDAEQREKGGGGPEAVSVL